MQAKRDALQGIWEKQERLQEATRNDANPKQDCALDLKDAQEVEAESLQKSLQLIDSTGGKRRRSIRKSLRKFGSSGRTRTYNPSVNSRMLYH